MMLTRDLPQMSSNASLDYETLYVLISRQGTLEQVGAYLRDKGLPSTAGSWQTMSSRLRKLRDQNRLSDKDLLNILRQTEEFGSQHVFLFEKVAQSDISYLFEPQFDSMLAAAKLPPLNTALVMDMPDSATIAEVRKEFDGDLASIIFKIVEKRHTYEVEEQVYPDGRIIATKNPLPYRSVSILRISENGYADLRVSSNSDVHSYEGFAASIWNALATVVQKLQWRPISLDRLKLKLMDPSQREKVKAIFGLRHSQHTNLEGMRLSAASPAPWSSIYDHSGTIGSLDHFNKIKDDARCDRMVVILRGDEAANLRDITLNLSGEEHELAISRKVTETEYEWILKTIFEFNK